MKQWYSQSRGKSPHYPHWVVGNAVIFQERTDRTSNRKEDAAILFWIRGKTETKTREKNCLAYNLFIQIIKESEPTLTSISIFWKQTLLLGAPAQPRKQTKAYLNKTNRGHWLPSSPSLLLHSQGAHFQRGEVGHPMRLWETETETEIRKSTEGCFIYEQDK